MKTRTIELYGFKIDSIYEIEEIEKMLKTGAKVTITPIFTLN